MNIKPITCEADYQAALVEMESLFNSEEGTEEFDKLNVLATLVDVYEANQTPMEFPHPIEYIEFIMDQRALTRKDMEDFLGNKSKVSEVLSRKIGLSTTMIRNLVNGLGMNANVLIQEYAQEKKIA